MKKFITYISFIFILVITFGLGSFFSWELRKDKLKQKRVVLHPMDKRFIEEEEVMSLIKLQDSEMGKVSIESIEKKLEKNPYISKAEVYKDLNNNLYADIEQYKPIARIIGTESYYIDINGEKCPLSKHYTENAILVFGNFNKKQLNEVYKLVKHIKKDPLLNEIITEIHFKNTKYILRTKDLKADVIFGKTENFSMKLDKLKAMYMYLTHHKLNKKYHQINLEYNKQVVCN